MRKQQGFTLVELALVLIIMGLMVTMMIPAASSQIEAQRRKETIKKMAVLDDAILAFVMVNRRLPCPADGTVASGTVGAGFEVRTSGDCGPQTSGVVPWSTLGLTEADATDGYFTRFTYRVASNDSKGVTRDGAMDATYCDPTGTALATTPASGPQSCSTGCDRTTPTNRIATCTSPSNFLSGRGLRVTDGVNLINDPATGTGAAYVLISHMSEGGGGYISSGIIPDPSVAPGTSEAINSNGNAVLSSSSAYVHSNLISTGSGAGTNHFDDLLSHPSVSQLMVKAQLGPRSQ